MNNTTHLPFHLTSPSGLQIKMNGNGSISRFEYKDIILNLFPGNQIEGGLSTIYLRCIDAMDSKTRGVPLFGPQSEASYHLEADAFVATGRFEDVLYEVRLELASGDLAWFWHVTLQNVGQADLSMDLILAQDIALAPYGAIRLNEYYVSQYLDHTALDHHQRGTVVATRQNLAMGGRNPWCLIGSMGRGVSYATDALQIFGGTGRPDGALKGVVDGLPGCRLQHEHAMVGIQNEPMSLKPGETVHTGFFGWLEENHPEATSPSDLMFVDRALGLLHDRPHMPVQENAAGSCPTRSLFVKAPALSAAPLNEAELDRWFGPERRDLEADGSDILSFFYGRHRHVVLKAKNEKVLRPHGHIIRTGGLFTPDEAVLTSTVWMDGVFHSMVTQGHVSINRFLSTTHTYLSLFKTHGQRIFIETAAGWRRLDKPSAFDMSPEGCRWFYRHEGGLLVVRSEAKTDRHELTLDLEVVEGDPVRCLITHHVALNGDDGLVPMGALFDVREEGIFCWATPDSDVGRRFPNGGFLIGAAEGTSFESVDNDAMLFEDGVSRDEPYICLLTGCHRKIGLTIHGRLVEARGQRPVTTPQYWREATSGLTVAADAPLPLQRVAEILPWFAHNALIHFLAPRGLEQYSGGGWGTRDVSQGPVEYLLGIGQFEPIRDLLVRLFKNQNPDGDWPQWFMFFERERGIRPGDSHGDIIFWPLLALGQYLLATGDVSLLREKVPFFDVNPQKAEEASIREHIGRALKLIRSRLIQGTALESYGHGDWNDSLQPADPAMRDHLCSAWTVTLHYQVLTTLAEALGQVNEAALAGELEQEAQDVLRDFRQFLLVDGVITGYADFEKPEQIEYLLHPRDQRTGLRYSVLPMIHAVINHMLSPEEAAAHLALIRLHLIGPDGAHLFDRPMIYRGGPMRIFQRAETSSYFGREIGLMYTHAHLRYAEALWHVGDVEGFFDAVAKTIPINIQSLVKPAARRQANCYYSSSDAAFKDRFEAYESYDRALKGEIPLEGGWRVYSSGAGIATGLILRCLLGIRPSRSQLVIDPMIPTALETFRVDLDIAGARFDVTYRRGHRGFGVEALELNGTALPFTRLEHPYRVGGAAVSLPLFQEALVDGVNWLSIDLG